MIHFKHDWTVPPRNNTKHQMKSMCLYWLEDQNKGRFLIKSSHSQRFPPRLSVCCSKISQRKCTVGSSNQAKEIRKPNKETKLFWTNMNFLELVKLLLQRCVVTLNPHFEVSLPVCYLVLFDLVFQRMAALIYWIGNCPQLSSERSPRYFK